MKLTYTANTIQDTYFLNIETMFGDADMYKNATIEIASADIEKTLLEFFIFKQFMDAGNSNTLSQELYDQVENEELEDNFSWIKKLSYEYDLGTYGRVCSYSLEYYDEHGKKFDVKISDEPNLAQVFKRNESFDDAMEKALSLLQKNKLEEIIDEGKPRAQKLKV